MRRSITTAGLIITLLMFATTSGNVIAYGGHKMFEVTITNITKGQVFTPILVGSHGVGIKLFELGGSASGELEQLAEGGDTGPLKQALMDAGALDVVTTGALLPGDSVTVEVKTNRWNRHLSVAAMLVPTNDTFMAINGMRGPGIYGKTEWRAPAYDAGTEENDELCSSIPGPPGVCGGEGYNPNDVAEGFVHINNGFQGIGDLSAADYDWRNPVAKVTVRKVRR